jgi:hypothetical protein
MSESDVVIRVEAFTEGATLAVVFLAVEVLSATAAANWG